MVDEMRMMKGLSPDKSAGRRRGVMGLRKNLPTSPRLRDALLRAKDAEDLGVAGRRRALSRGFLGSEKIGEYLG